jgi:hypothetical protein
MSRVLVTGAGGSAAANVIDALRRANDYWIVGGDVSAVRLHLSQADERVMLPRCSERSEWASSIRRIVERFQLDVVHVQPDPEVIALSEVRDDIGASTFLPSHDALVCAADKVRFADRMAQAKVPTPVSSDIVDLDDAETQTDKLLADFERVWIRARTGAGSRAALPVRSGLQARHWIEYWMSEKGLQASDFMAAEMLPGREFAYQSVWHRGQLICGQARERVEYLYGFLSPSGQSSTPAVARTVREDAVDQTAIRAIQALDPEPHGVYCVDAKTGEDDVIKVTEINAGRFFTTSNFFAAAGLNMPDIAMRLAQGETIEPLGSSPLPADLYWIRMVDMGYALVPGDELDQWTRP